jgi:hypothetical protein
MPFDFFSGYHVVSKGRLFFPMILYFKYLGKKFGDLFIGTNEIIA